jgi:adenosylcobinamide-GDP ribazoletransferase
MAVAPAIGLALGGVLAAVAWALDRAHFDTFPIAAVVVALLALLTRGLHLDGLADTVDGLGSYRDRDRALAIMASPEVGPLGVAAIVALLLVDTAALTSLVGGHSWLAIAVGIAVGRLAISVCCRRGVPAARADGLGALVADSLPPAIPLVWIALLGALAMIATNRRWPGIVAVGLAVVAVLVLLQHVCRRLGGITGDVLGAACEIATAISLLILSID